MLNVFCGMGRMVKDPELKQTNGGTEYVRFTLAIQRDFNRDQTDFLDCIAWRQTATTICNYVHKGDRITVNGSVSTSMSGEGDNKRKYTEITVNNIGFVETKGQQKEEPAEVIEPPEVVTGTDEVTGTLPFDLMGNY